MANVNDLKRELSKLSGVDFFNPKYRDVFKKHLPDETDAEEERLKELDIEEKPVDKKEVEDKVEDIKKAEDEREIDKIEEDKADNSEKADEKREEVREESKEIGKQVDELKTDKTFDELLDTKIELELLRGNIREDRIEPAKRLIKNEVHNVDELAKIKGILKDYPEWVKGYKTRGFGMAVDDDDDGLTAEERRLKEMGIDPK